MSDRESIQPAGWRKDAERLGLSGVLRDGRWLFVSGHTGYPDHAVEAQIREAYGDVTASLEEAGSGWADVVSVTSYHVGLRDHLDAIVRTHKEHVREP
jgi:enamine deaminase RidA (YjgF/YER057c/UK114 family)